MTILAQYFDILTTISGNSRVIFLKFSNDFSGDAFLNSSYKQLFGVSSMNIWAPVLSVNLIQIIPGVYTKLARFHNKEIGASRKS